MMGLKYICLLIGVLLCSSCGDGSGEKSVVLGSVFTPLSSAVLTVPDTVTMTQYIGTTALCYDGSYSTSTHCSGTCSWHGGVYQWMGILSGCGS